MVDYAPGGANPPYLSAKKCSAIAMGDDLMTLAEKWKGEGMVEGIQKGIQKGIAKGRAETVRKIAEKMLEKGAKVAFVSSVTGLSPEVIESLAE